MFVLFLFYYFIHYVLYKYAQEQLNTKDTYFIKKDNSM